MQISVYNNLKKILTVSLIVAFCSLFYFNFFVEGFIITVSVVVLPILLYFYRNINSMYISLSVAIISPAFRLITLLMSGHTLSNAFYTIWPEIFFYISYGLIFYMVYSRNERYLNQLIIAIYFSDFLSNCLEVILRINSIRIPNNIFQGLALVALVRTSIVLIFILILRHISTLMIRDEHEKNYRKLLLLTSNFWSEIYFMEKNIKYIENLMADAYNLYQYSEQYAQDSEIIRKSLVLAKDVHEVKKDYIRVIQGLEAITEKRFSELNMGIDEIVELTVENTRKLISHRKPTIDISTHLKSHVKVRYHFYMTSVIQNLLSNAIEAIDEDQHGAIHIELTETNNLIEISVSDNGQGIKKRDIEYVFNPGFSSKYTKESGDAKRGLGLSIVKDLVENEFKGTVQVKTEQDVGTTFTLLLNAQNLS